MQFLQRILTKDSLPRYDISQSMEGRISLCSDPRGTHAKNSQFLLQLTLHTLLFSSLSFQYGSQSVVFHGSHLGRHLRKTCLWGSHCLILRAKKNKKLLLLVPWCCGGGFIRKGRCMLIPHIFRYFQVSVEAYLESISSLLSKQVN